MKRILLRFIFYSILTLLLIFAGGWLKPEEAKGFWQEKALWLDPILGGMSAGLLLSCLGTYILLKRIVFVGLTLSQSAAFGIFFFFWITNGVEIHSIHSAFPMLFGTLIALLSIWLVEWRHSASFLSRESKIGLLYLLTAGGTLLIGDRIAEGKHEIDHLLFGEIVALSHNEMIWTVSVTVLLLTVHFLFRRIFLYSAVDSTFMKVRGVSVNRWDGFFYLTLTIGLTLSMKVIGALPTFGLALIPSFIALRGSKGMSETFIVAGWIGLLLPLLGYFFSFLFSFPTGGAVIGVGGIYLLFSFFERTAFKTVR